MHTHKKTACSNHQTVREAHSSPKRPAKPGSLSMSISCCFCAAEVGLGTASGVSAPLGRFASAAAGALPAAGGRFAGALPALPPLTLTILATGLACGLHQHQCLSRHAHTQSGDWPHLASWLRRAWTKKPHQHSRNSICPKETHTICFQCQSAKKNGQVLAPCCCRIPHAKEVPCHKRSDKDLVSVSAPRDSLVWSSGWHRRWKVL